AFLCERLVIEPSRGSHDPGAARRVPAAALLHVVVWRLLCRGRSAGACHPIRGGRRVVAKWLGFGSRVLHATSRQTGVFDQREALGTVERTPGMEAKICPWRQEIGRKTRRKICHAKD